jgi:hypothetical protein
MGSVSHARAARADRAPEAQDICRTEVRQFVRLQIAPQQFNRVEIRRVRGKPLDLQPLVLGGQVHIHAAAFVGAEAIPDEYDALTAEMPLQGADEGDERGVGVRGRPRLKVQARPMPIPTKRHGRGDRQPFPVPPGVPQHGRPPAGSPGASHHGPLGHAALVLENYPGVPPSRVFFTCGHRWRCHRRTAAASRSRAWRAGRCTDQFSPCRMRQTWAG